VNAVRLINSADILNADLCISVTFPLFLIMTASPILFGKPGGFDINDYNSIRNACMVEFNYSYAQLFGRKYWELYALFHFNEASVHYSITGKKRHWLRMQFDNLVEFFDLYEG